MKKKIPLIIISAIFSVILWGSISLSGEYYANVSVPLKITDYSNEFTLGTNLPKNITIKLRGQGWKLFSVNIGKDVAFNISVANDTGWQEVELMDYLTDNRWMLSELSIMDILPHTISFNIERKITKRVPIVPDLVVDFKVGYGLANPVELEPDSITIEGPQSLVDSLSELVTKTIKLSSLDQKTIKTIDFILLPGTTYKTKFVTVDLNVQRIVDNQFDDIPVKVLNVPPDRDVILLPNKVSCSVRGGIEILGKLDPDKFSAFVYYRDVVLDSVGSVLPKIILPENTILQFVKPERLRYVIKKYR
ncbi:YbbR-like domain-containing protein [Bacteroidota bacterium]